MYNDHYGLTGRPFQLTPDPRFYFESGTHKKAMAYLGYGLAQGEGFIVITGEIGSGKTTLTGHLLNTVDPMRIKAVRLVSTQLNGSELLSSIATNFGVQAEGVDKATLLDRIESKLIDHARAGQKTLIIVDEAQNLDQSALEELRMLSNFQAGEHAMVQLLLLGQPEFKDRVDSAPELEQLRQRVIATHHLTAMQADEVRPYVEHRLALVGWSGAPSLADSAVEPLFRYSAGVPRKLNNIMTRVLLMGSVERRSVIDGALVEAVIADLSRDASAEESRAAPRAVAANGTRPDPVTLDLAARMAMLESHADEQGAVLRRVLTLLVQWAESEDPRPTTEFFRAPVA
jgi:general secretion pathway protein A